MMENDILELLGRSDYVPANVPDLLRGLNLPGSSQQTLQASLRQLLRSGRIARIKGNRYILPQEADLIPGRIQITARGRGFLLPDEPGVREISVPASETGVALHGDHVLVRRNLRPLGAAERKPEENDTGTVVRVLERRRTQIVGTLKQGRQFLYVIPEDPRMPHDIYVPPPRDTGRQAQVGDKVVVTLLHWESRHTNPEGEVIEVLGPPTAEGVDMLAVLRHYDLPLKFPQKVLREARSFGSEVSSEDCAGRTDCRGHAVVTIDPDDAKDFDDAFCLRRTPSKRWQLWVHIADVSHYVKPGSALDVEARRRGNSTYLVDRVIPMLPEALSNELCSLKPHTDRLTKCVEFLIDDDGNILKSRCYPAVIHSQKRYSYEEALEILRGQGSGPLEEMLRQADRLARRLRQKRFQNGALELDFPETKIRLDETGKVREIVKLESDEAHQLIEEFMLLANETVAGKLIKMKRPAVHRVHEKPNPARLEEYRQDVASHHIPCGNLDQPGQVQKLLKRLNGLAIGPALKIGFLKSMNRARYAVDSLGHYGLAKDKYTHFTSPIRRYADLVVHRSLFDTERQTQGGLTKIAEHLSFTERNSSDAERDSKQVKLHAFLQAQLQSRRPTRYPALVIDIRNFGFFVDVSDLGLSGLVPLSLLKDDFYEFDALRGLIKGRRTGVVIRVGDQVEVHVAKVDTFKKLVDFRLAPAAGAAKKRRSRREDRPAKKKKATRAPQSTGEKEKAGGSPKKASRPQRTDRRGTGSPSGSRPSKTGQEADAGSEGNSGTRRRRDRRRGGGRGERRTSVEGAKTPTPTPAPTASSDDMEQPVSKLRPTPRRRRKSPGSSAGQRPDKAQEKPASKPAPKAKAKRQRKAQQPATATPAAKKASSAADRDSDRPNAQRSGKPSDKRRAGGKKQSASTSDRPRGQRRKPAKKQSSSRGNEPVAPAKPPGKKRSSSRRRRRPAGPPSP